MVSINHNYELMRNIFSSKKQTITLSKALELKSLLEEKLKTNHNFFKSENSVIQGQKRNVDLKKIVKENDTLRNQLIQMKLVIQKANLVIPEGEKTCIHENVFELSEKKTTILNLLSTIKVCYEGKHQDEKTKVVSTYGKPVYSRSELEDWVNKLRKECREIEGKLTILNNLINVELPFKTNLV